MKVWARVFLCVVMFSHSSGSWAAPAPSAFEVAVSYEFKPERVNTDRIMDLDPEVRNAHRQRWVLSRKIELKGLEIRNIPRQRFGVQSRGIQATGQGYMRGRGAWYQDLDKFPCQKEPDPLFATEAGVAMAVNQAGEGWTDLLKKEGPKLSLMLNKISEPTPRAALKRGLQEYQKWRSRVESTWKGQGAQKARAAEWAFYRQKAQEKGHCRHERASQASASDSSASWLPMMEEVVPLTSPEGWVKPLVRAPARRWDGAFSVRLDVQVGSRTLSGQFLLDSGSTRSLISQAWLKGQGYLPALVELPEAGLERVVLDGEAGMAPLALMDHVSLSNYPLDFLEFLVFDTDLFLPPEQASSCCDGVLGVDFLEKHVVEFLPGRANEIILWPRKGFQPLARAESEKAKTGLEIVDPIWTEAYVDASERIVSEGGGLILEGKPVEWDTGNEAGMEFLGRGPFIMDLPHGRVWFSAPALKTSIRHNQTGLTVRFIHRDGDRVLKVLHLQPGSEASALSKEGLKEGLEILQIDSLPVENMSLWDVEQHLAGAYGNPVTLQWMVRKGWLKTVSMKTKKS